MNAKRLRYSPVTDQRNSAFILYGHGGSYNHGCEALTRCTIALLRDKFPDRRIILSTHFADQDREFDIDADEFVERNPSGQSNDETYAPTIDRIQLGDICIHVAGDNYCYQNWQRYAALHYMSLNRGAKSILWSCSIDPEAIDAQMRAALKSHHLITSREEMTYKALLSHGLTNVVKVSDIAFTLSTVHIDFDMRDFVALNISPLVIRKKPLVKTAFQKLVDYILDETDMGIALLPHVVNPVDNDYDALRAVDVRDSNRVMLVSDKLSAGQYKHIVSKARFCVTARTHLAIAAYSACVPTLAIGYNVKSQGIAADVKMAEHVIRAEDVFAELDIVNAFRKLVLDENAISKKLKEIIPAYVGSAVNEAALEVLAGGYFE